MSTFKKLAGQTAIYGISSIVGRLINFLLTPLHTSVLSQSDFGIMIDVYSITAFLMVVLTFGMETAFFRFYKEGNQDKVLTHTLFPVLFLSLLFLSFTALFLPGVAEALKYGANPEFAIYAVVIIMMDAVAAIPFAKLRAQNKAKRFVSIRLTQIGLFVLMNVFIFMLCPWLLEQQIAVGFISSIYKPELGVAYIFILNIISNVVMIALLLPSMKGFKPVINWSLEKRYLSYSAPLVVAGLAGIANEMIDRQFLKYLLKGSVKENFAQIGIYGANYKIATFMMLFIQAFRFAAEPFFFGQAKATNPKQTYAKVLKYFALVQATIFIALVGFIDLIKLFIDEKYWSGLYLAPILIFANLLIGINMNLNIWYKLEDKTRFGAYITFFGLAFTVLLNYFLIPIYGILGAAIATVISYAAMTLYSYYLNQKHYRCPYETGKIALYLFVSLGLAFVCFTYLRAAFVLNGLILLGFVGFVFLLEKKEIMQVLKNR